MLLLYKPLINKITKKTIAPEPNITQVISDPLYVEAFSTKTVYKAYEITAVNKNTQPGTEKLEETLKLNTVKITPAKVINIPPTCIGFGFLFKIKKDAIKAETGIQAKNTPLSDADVLLIPNVSKAK